LDLRPGSIVFTYVASHSLNHQARRLRADYDAAFATWSREISSLQLQATNPLSTNASVAAAHHRVAEAERHYHDTRDCLMQSLLDRSCHHPSASRPARAAARV